MSTLLVVSFLAAYGLLLLAVYGPLTRIGTGR